MFYLRWYPGTRHRNQSRLSCLQRILNAFCSERRFVFISQLRTHPEEGLSQHSPKWERDTQAVKYSCQKVPQSCSPFGPLSPKGSLTVTCKSCRTWTFPGWDNLPCLISTFDIKPIHTGPFIFLLYLPAQLCQTVLIKVQRWDYSDQSLTWFLPPLLRKKDSLSPLPYTASLNASLVVLRDSSEAKLNGMLFMFLKNKILPDQ